MSDNNQYSYDVCLSFAGEDRSYVEKVAKLLLDKGIRVFYDQYEEINLWGKDLYEYLIDVYKNSARYCVIFISENYKKKIWTNHERRSAQARAIRETKEYILPVKLQNVDVKELFPTLGYLDGNKKKPAQIAKMIIEKVGPTQSKNFFPPKPDKLFLSLKKLYKHFKIKKKKNKQIIEFQARVFFETLMRLNESELKVLFAIFIRGCSHDLPKNVHTAIDLVSRDTEFPNSKIIRLLEGLRSLGIFCKLKTHTSKKDEHIGDVESVYLEYVVLTDSKYGGDATDVAAAVVGTVTDAYCYEHGMEKLMNLDFSNLSSATFKEDSH